MKLTLEKLLLIKEEIAKIYFRIVIKRLVAAWIKNELKWSKN